MSFNCRIDILNVKNTMSFNNGLDSKLKVMRLKLEDNIRGKKYEKKVFSRDYLCCFSFSCHYPFVFLVYRTEQQSDEGTEQRLCCGLRTDKVRAD